MNPEDMMHYRFLFICVMSGISVGTGAYNMRTFYPKFFGLSPFFADIFYSAMILGGVFLPIIAHKFLLP